MYFFFCVVEGVLMMCDGCGWVYDVFVFWEVGELYGVGVELFLLGVYC